MSINTSGTVAFAFTLFIYWLGGGDFERGIPLAIAVSTGVISGILVAMLLLATRKDQ
jgi:hypothetical protein